MVDGSDVLQNFNWVFEFENRSAEEYFQSIDLALQTYPKNFKLSFVDDTVMLLEKPSCCVRVYIGKVIALLKIYVG